MSDDLERFVEAQRHVVDGVLTELRAGRKTGHWMWFVFPQLRGLGRSEYATFYGIAGLDEARALPRPPGPGRSAPRVRRHGARDRGQERGGRVRIDRRRQAPQLDDAVPPRRPDDPRSPRSSPSGTAARPTRARTTSSAIHPLGRYPSGVLPKPIPLPADDPDLAGLTLDELALRWADAAARAPISGEAMTGADRKAQALGTPGAQLMEHAGTAVAAAARALVAFNGREGRPVLILAGPGNNGGDGFVAARHLARWGTPVIAVLVSGDPRPGTRDAARELGPPRRASKA